MNRIKGSKITKGWVFGWLFWAMSQAAIGQTYQLSGTIYGGSEPLPGASVTLSLTGQDQGTVTTDESGNYSFQVASGTYNIAVIPNHSDFGDSQINDVTVNNNDVNFNVVLLPVSATTYELRGVVRDANGDPVERVTVQAIDSNYQGGSVYTQANGSFVLTLLASTYRISLTDGQSSSETFPQSWSMLNIISDLEIYEDTVLPNDLVLSPVVTLSGKITDPDGAGIAGSRVDIDDHWTIDGIYYGATGSVYSDGSGNYTFNLFPFDNYTVRCARPSGSDLMPSIHHSVSVQDDTERDFALIRAPHLTGVVRDSNGNLISGVTVHAIDSQYQGGSVYTDGNGAFSLPLLPSTYRISLWDGISSSEALPQRWSILNILRDVVVDGPTELDDDLFLPPPVTLHGRITDPDGGSISSSRVEIDHHWTVDEVFHSVMASINSDGSGHYSFILFPYDDYTISCARPSGSPLLGATYQHVSVLTDSEQDFALTAVPTLSGSVHDAQGRPVSGARVGAIDPSYQGGHAYTNGAGQFTMNIPASTYRVSVTGSHSFDPLLPDTFGIYRIVENFVLTTNAHLPLVLPATVSLSGRTTDANGVSVPGVRTAAHGSWLVGNTTFESDSDDTSNLTGNYSMPLFPYAAYDTAITPPSESGFAAITINDLDISNDLLQNVTLSYIDSEAPLILAGPYANHLSDSSAVISWQTNELATTELRYGTSLTLTSRATEDGYRTTHEIMLIGLAPNTRYHVQAQATDRSGNGPVSSRIISFVTADLPDTEPPLILFGPVVTAISDRSATIEWQTSGPAIGSLAYGTSPSLSLSAPPTQLTLQHQVVLTDLTPDTLYYYQVSCVDAAGNGPTLSELADFTTQALPDAQAPLIIAGPMAIDITDTEATIVWETNEPASSGVSFNDGTAFGLVSDDQLVSQHRVRLTGLSPQTEYSYTVSATDGAGNGPTLSDEQHFTSLALPDTEPPLIIMGPIVLGITLQSAVIRWDTNEPADTLIEYGTSEIQLDQQASRAALVTNHNLPLTGLESATRYYYRVRSTDANGNGPTSSAIFFFLTPSHRDRNAPVFMTAPELINLTDSSATLFWETDEPADTVVVYGKDGRYNGRYAQPQKTMRHQVTLAGLQAGSSYDLEISSTDLSGNRSATTDLVVRAKAGANSKTGSGFTTNSQPDTRAPELRVLQVESVSNTTALIYWESDEIADSRIFYNTLAQPLTLFAGEITHLTEHLIQLTRLQPATTYSFQASSVDVAGNQSTAAEMTFTTLNQTDVTAPELMGQPTATLVGSDVLISWSTDEFATSQVDFSTQVEAESYRMAGEGFSENHQLKLTNLEQGLTWYYRVTSTDSAGNSMHSAVASITTPGSPPSLSVEDIVVAEGDGDALFTVSLTRASSEPVSLDFATSETSASAGEDFTTTTGTLLILPGEIQQTLRVAIIGDTVLEDEERFQLNLSTAVNAMLANTTAICTIQDDDLVCPLINQQPQEQTACRGMAVSLQVEASGSELHYQWHKQGVAIDGANASIFAIAALSTEDIGSYSCLVSNSCESLQTEIIDLNMSVTPAAPAAIEGPVVACAGSRLTYSTTQESGVERYHWQLPQGAVIDVQDRNRIEIILANHSGEVSVYATNGCGDSSTTSLAVTVSPLPDTANAGEDISLLQGETAGLSAIAPETGSGLWSVLSGPATSLAQFSDSTDPHADFNPNGGIGDYRLQWTITSGSCDPSVDQMDVSVQGSADLSLSLAVDEAAPNVGENVNFSVTISNEGPSAATDIQTGLVLPQGLDYVSHTGAGLYQAGLWTVSELDSGGQASLNVNVRVSEANARTIVSQINGSAQADPDSTPGNDQASEDDYAQVVLIPKSADLELTAQLNQEQASVGETVILTLTLQNQGPNSGTEIRLQLDLASGLEVTSQSGGYDSSSGIWLVGSLNSGSSIELSLGMQAHSLGAKTANIELIASQVYDPDSSPANGAPLEDDFASVTLTPLSNLSLSEALLELLAQDDTVDSYDDDQISPAEAAAVTVLHLSDTGLTDFDGIDAFTSLTELYIARNGLHRLPDLSSLDALRILDCAGNQIRDFQAEASFALPANLSVLEASANRLEYLPEAIYQLSGLESLHLARNGLTSLADGIGMLEALTHLDLMQNRLRDLPQGLGQIATLRQLWVSFNGLEVLPELGGTQLEQLAVSHNRLSNLPSLSELQALTQVLADYNRLTEVDTLASNIWLATGSGHEVSLQNNLMAGLACDGVALIAARADASSALFLYGDQGNFTTISNELPQWRRTPATTSPLLGWVRDIAENNLSYKLNCGP